MSQIQGVPERIRLARESAGLTQYELASRCSVRDLAISLAELGKSTPKASLLLSIAQSTGTTVDWILTGDGQGPRPRDEVA